MIFCLFFVATLKEHATGKREATITCRFNGETTALPPLLNLIPFCYPAGVDTVRAIEHSTPGEHCFTLTGADASRLHGFCRVTLPPQSPVSPLRRLPHVLCIVSPHLWPDLFSKALEIVDKLLRC